jgi:flagellar FliL protein
MANIEEAPEIDAQDAPAAATAGWRNMIKGLLSNRKLILFGGVGLLLLAGAGGAATYFLTGQTPAEPVAADAPPALPATPPQVTFYDVPEILVNIQTADGTQAYLKLGLSLELESDAEKAGIQVLMPRVVDQFQAYLRELRLEDLKGSAGIARIKEELARRVNEVAAPYRVRDVLLKEMIVQ